MTIIRLIQGTSMAGGLILLASLEPAGPSAAPAVESGISALQDHGATAHSADSGIAVPQPVLFSDG